MQRTIKMMYNKLYEEGSKILQRKYSKIEAYQIYKEFCMDYTQGDKCREYYSVMGGQDPEGLEKFCKEMDTEFVQFSSDLIRAMRKK